MNFCRARFRSGRIAERRSGFSLLEVLVALMLITFMGFGAVDSLMNLALSVRSAQRSDEAFVEACGLLDAALLWPVRDLDQRLGERQQGVWLLRIERPQRGLYVLSVHSSSSAPALLATAVRRRTER